MTSKSQRKATRTNVVRWVARTDVEEVEQYIEREERREQLRQDALAAWTEYQATGRYVTGDEADAWLARLEADGDAEPPPPHD
jgi:predicted transcriptional regulator